LIEAPLTFDEAERRFFLQSPFSMQAHTQQPCAFHLTCGAVL
jgi:hypothetical protein